MKMETKEKKTYQCHEDRILEDAAIGSSIVPAGVSSTSNHGPGSTLPTSVIPEAALVDESETKRKTLAEETKEIKEGIGNQGKIEEEEEIKKKEDKEDMARNEGISTTSKAIDNNYDSTMDIDELRGNKRKKTEGLSSEDSEEDEIVFRGARKQRIISEDATSLNEKDEIQSVDPIETECSPEEVDSRILEMSKEYISRNKVLEIEDAKEMIETEKREENRRRKEDRKKAEELKKKKEEKKTIAEANILELLGKKKLKEEDYIENMTASDVASAALNYLERMDLVRVKCGTMKGSLSKELREMNESLVKIVRVLLAKAEEKGDPLFLKRKIEELIKKHRDEEEKRMKEVKKLSEIVTNLSKENKEMRREMERIRVSLEKKRVSDPMEDSHLEEKKRQASLKKDEEKNRNLIDGTYQPRRSADGRPMMVSCDEY